jgi:RNA polymerase sigma-70 factor (ECF subfamily)
MMDGAMSRMAPPERLRQETDEALSRRAAARDAEAFAELVARHHDGVLRIVGRGVSSDTEAEDLVQRTFLRALEALRANEGEVGGGRSFRAWIAVIAMHVASNNAREASRWTLARVRLAPVSGVLEPLADGVLAVSQEAQRARVAFEQLPPRQREVFTLRVDGELSFEEIAQALGIDAGNARVNFHHAVRRLRALLSDDEPEEGA